MIARFFVWIYIAALIALPCFTAGSIAAFGGFNFAQLWLAGAFLLMLLGYRRVATITGPASPTPSAYTNLAIFWVGLLVFTPMLGFVMVRVFR